MSKDVEIHGTMTVEINALDEYAHSHLNDLLEELRVNDAVDIANVDELEVTIYE